MVYLGVDPGQSGAIAAINKDGDAFGFLKLSETEHDISQWLRVVCDGDWCVTALLEQVHSMPHQGVASSFKFGASYGFVRGLLVAHDISFETITPAKWQQEMRCRSGGDKNVTKAAAQRLWPRLKITHANADALLLAELCRRRDLGIRQA